MAAGKGLFLCYKTLKIQLKNRLVLFFNSLNCAACSPLEQWKSSTCNDHDLPYQTAKLPSLATWKEPHLKSRPDIFLGYGEQANLIKDATSQQHVKKIQTNMQCSCACIRLVIYQASTLLFFHSLLLVVPLNVISKQWPEEYKFAEFSHHSEQR